MTEEELRAIEARVAESTAAAEAYADTLRLVAEVRRLRNRLTESEAVIRDIGFICIKEMSWCPHCGSHTHSRSEDWQDECPAFVGGEP